MPDAKSGSTRSSLTFITEGLPDFPVNKPKTVTIEASGGRPPYRFKIMEGALPKGLTLSESGTISGAAREVSDVTIRVKVYESGGTSLTQAFQVLVT